MAKASRHSPQLTAQERRARRIRAAFLACFAVFLVGALLAVAWFGLAASQRQDPQRPLFPVPPDGVLQVRLDVLHKIVLEPLEVGPEDLAPVLGALAPMAHIEFWARDGGEPADWAVWLAAERRYPLAFPPLRQALERIEGLGRMEFPLPAEEQDGSAGPVYLIRERGLLLASRAPQDWEPASSAWTRHPGPTEDLLALYSSASAGSPWLPDYLKDALGEDAPQQEQFDGEMRWLELRWLSKGEEQFVEMRYLGSAEMGQVKQLPWFSPVPNLAPAEAEEL